MRALDALGLDSDADFPAIKKAWREKARRSDVKPNDAEAAQEFELQIAYEVLKSAERRGGRARRRETGLGS